MGVFYRLAFLGKTRLQVERAVVGEIADLERREGKGVRKSFRFQALISLMDEAL